MPDFHSDPMLNESRDPPNEEADARDKYYCAAEHRAEVESRDDAEETGDSRGTDYWRALNHVEPRDSCASPRPISPSKEDLERRDGISSPLALSPPSLVLEPMSPPNMTEQVLQQPNVDLFVPDVTGLCAISEGRESNVSVRNSDGQDQRVTTFTTTEEQQPQPDLDSKIAAICQELSLSYSGVRQTTEGRSIDNDCRQESPDEAESLERKFVAAVPDTTSTSLSEGILQWTRVQSCVMDFVGSAMDKSSNIVDGDGTDEGQTTERMRIPQKEDFKKDIVCSFSTAGKDRASPRDDMNGAKQSSHDNLNEGSLDDTMHRSNDSTRNTASGDTASNSRATSPRASHISSAASPRNESDASLAESIMDTTLAFEVEPKCSWTSSTDIDREDDVVDKMASKLQDAKGENQDTVRYVGESGSFSTNEEDDRSLLQLVASVDYIPSLTSPTSTAGNIRKLSGFETTQNCSKLVAEEDAKVVASEKPHVDFNNAADEAHLSNGCFDFSECFTFASWEDILQSSHARRLAWEQQKPSTINNTKQNVGNQQASSKVETKTEVSNNEDRLGHSKKQASPGISMERADAEEKRHSDPEQREGPEKKETKSPKSDLSSLSPRDYFIRSAPSSPIGSGRIDRDDDEMMVSISSTALSVVENEKTRRNSSQFTSISKLVSSVNIDDTDVLSEVSFDSGALARGQGGCACSASGAKRPFQC